MFDETNKYKNNGHFFFKKGDMLSVASIDVPNLPGVYYIIKLVKERVELVYIGKSGIINQNGEFKDQMLKGRINNKYDGVKRQQYFDQKLQEEKIEALDIYWFVTYDEKHKDLPGYIEGLLLQRFFEVHGNLPPWNKEF